MHCMALKASDMCRNNAINLMHDVIYLMPYTYKFIHMKNACISAEIKDHKLISHFKSCLPYYCQSTSDTPQK